ncbi:hypothetical protein GTQ99_22590, partial [Kineococcus sp. T13]
MSSAAPGDLPTGAPGQVPGQGPEPGPEQGPEQGPGQGTERGPGAHAGAGEPAGRQGLSPRGLLLAVSAFTAVLLTALLGVLHVPYVALSPGPVVDVIAGSHAGREQEEDRGQG